MIAETAKKEKPKLNIISFGQFLISSPSAQLPAELRLVPFVINTAYRVPPVIKLDSRTGQTSSQSCRVAIQHSRNLSCFRTIPCIRSYLMLCVCAVCEQACLGLTSCCVLK